VLKLIALAFVAAVSGVSAVTQFGRITEEMHSARLHGDWRQFYAQAQQLTAFLNGSPDAMLERARADVHLRRTMDAFATLDSVVRMGQSPAVIKTLRDFAPLRRYPQFRFLVSAMNANLIPRSNAAEAFSIADAGLLPEDVDYDPAQRRFFLTSIREAKIVSSDMRGRLRDFAQAPDRWPMLAIKVDSRRRIVWATEAALDGFRFVPKRDRGRSALLAFDLASGKLLRRIEAPRPSALGDMTLGSDGDVVVSDGLSGAVYRVGAVHAVMARIGNGDFLSPQTPAYAPDGKDVFVPDYARGIAVLNPTTKRVRWLPMEGKFALEGIDGMYFFRGSLLAVQNGTAPERVMAFRLAPTFDRVLSQRVIESATSRIDPTHGVVVGSDFYYIANSGWNELGDDGVVRKGQRLTSARIMVAHLH